MFDKDYNQIRDSYKDFITEIWEESFTIIMVDTRSDIGITPCSDIILVFAPTGELVLMTERVYRKNYTWYSWLKVKKLIQAERSKSKIDATLYTSINHGENFVDLTIYKKWWHEWARELV